MGEIHIRGAGMHGIASSIANVVAIAVAAAGCGGRAETVVRAAGGGAQFQPQTVASGLEVPWDLAFAPDGRIFVTERPGRIRVVKDGQLAPEPWATLNVSAQGEAGLTAIALPADFASTGQVYVLGTFAAAGGGLENRIVRFTERGGRGAEPTVIADHLPSESLHAGSALEFGPDGMLYVSTGDALHPERAQQMESLSGKLLRYTRDGAVPADNPFPGSPVYALGLRNVQGIDWERRTGAMFATEHGPSGFPAEGFRSGHDELNVLARGGNYGWSEVAGEGGGERFIDPLAVWDPAIAPSGLAIYTGSEFPEWQGSVFVGALRGRQLRRISVRQDASARAGWAATGQEVLLDGELGRIRAVRMGPDGHLYITTSNRDGRGSPAADDDRILRLVRR
jgi:glucose/arabinose dehydrogenase